VRSLRLSSDFFIRTTERCNVDLNSVELGTARLMIDVCSSLLKTSLGEDSFVKNQSAERSSYEHIVKEFRRVEVGSQLLDPTLNLHLAACFHLEAS